MSGGAPFFWANGQPNDETFNTVSGSPVQVQKIPLSAITSASITSVANIAALEALPTTGLPSGQFAFVRTVGAYWTLQTASALTPDGITIVPAAGGGQWIRTVSGVQEDALQTTAWFVNGSTGNDENPGTSLLPLATFQEIARRMGTWEPDIENIDVVIHGDLIQPTDFLNFLPSGTGSLSVLFPTNPAQQVFAGVLAGVVAKNTATGVPLQATAWAGALIGQLVINATRANSTAKVVAVGGGLVTLSQPLQAVPVPPASVANPTEVDTWANGDSVTVFTLVSCRVLRHGYVLNSFGTSGNFASWLYRCNLAAPANLEQTIITDLGNLIECTWEGTLNCFSSNVNITIQNTSPSVDPSTGGGLVVGGSLGGASVGQVVFQGGAAHAINLAISQTSNAAALGTGFAILSSITPSFIAGVNLDDVRVALDVVLTAQGLPSQIKTFLWGQGLLNLEAATVRCNGSATATLLLTGGVTLDGVGTAMALSSAAGVVTWSGPRTLTVAHLDAAVGAGGFTDATVFGSSGFTATNARSTLTNLAA